MLLKKNFKNMMIMNEFIKALENTDFENALKILQDNPELLIQKTDDGWNVLQLASYYNAPAIVDHCLKNLTYESINNVKVHPILIALEEKNEEAIQAFLDFFQPDKINWNIKEKSGENLVYLSIFYGLNKFVEPLLKKGVSAFEANNQGLNAISLAVEKGDVKLFDKLNEDNYLADNYNEVLIKKSIQYDHKDIFERLLPYTQLSSDKLFNLAAGFNSIKVLDSILQSGEIIPGMDQITKIVDLMCRRYENKDDIEAAKNLADYLFEIKIPFNKFVNEKSQSAWMLCIQNDNEAVFERLMSSNENVNVLDTENHSPLFYAIEKNNLRFVSLLLKKKANPHQTDKQKNTPLIKAVEIGNVEIVKEILKYYQMVNHTNINNEHALSIALKKRRMDIVTELIWAGGEITTNPVKFVEEKHMFFFGANGQTERGSYFDEQNIDNFVALSKLGFRLDQVNSEGDTFLLHFIKNGYMANFSALLRCQINPNQFDKNGNSALMCAALKKQDEYFNSLLRRFRNIDLNHKNNNGENIYDFVLKTGKVKRMEKLLDYDDNLSLENAMKASKLIARNGKLENYIQKFLKAGLDFSFVDENKNNLLMFSLAGGNLENFRYLIETIGVNVDLKHANKNGNTVESIIQAMPPEIAKDFISCINKNLKNQLNKQLNN